MSQQDFLNALLKYLGQPVEAEDPTALDQCMDWAFKGCDVLGIDRGTIRHQYAYQVWKNPNDQTVAQFEFIPNTPNGVPQMGDLPIFDQNVVGVTGNAGHICWATGKGDSNSFESLDQNWNGVQHVTQETHAYTGVLGWLRPRIFQQQIVDQLRTDRDTNYNNFQQADQALQVSQKALTDVQNQFEIYKQTHPDTPVSTPNPTVPEQPTPPDTSPQQSNLLQDLWLLIKAIFTKK